jgi:site-specific DNA-methyltransferase (adenine-specific)
MRTVSADAITILPNRQRRDFDEAKLQEFADGISKRGLFHPVVLRPHQGGLALVAGERRLRAVKDLAALGTSITHDGQQVPAGEIPYTLLSDLDPLAYEEAELEENVHRLDLSWVERATAIARIAALRRKQAEAAGTPLPTTAAIALEVRGSSEGIHHETVRREIIVAQHLGNPLVAGAKTLDDAFKVLRKEESATKHRELGIQVGRTFTASVHSALNTDAVEWLRTAAADQFDCILTDPPYGMGADTFGDSGGIAAGAHGYSDTPELAQSCYLALAREGFRITKPQAHLYAFCDIGSFGWIKLAFEEAGWQVFRTPLIWYKKSGMRAPWPELGPQRKYETILYAIKGKKPILKMAGDVLDYAPDTNLGHAAQKPADLFEDLLRRSCLPGSSVLDPFMGSGPIFPAAHAIKCKATGIELDPASYGIAVGRLTALKAQGEIDLLLGA